MEIRDEKMNTNDDYGLSRQTVCKESLIKE